MTNLPLRTFSQIVADQTATLQASLSANSTVYDATQQNNLTPGSPLLALMESNAGVALFLEFLNWKVLRSTRMQTCVGSDLDTFAADFLFSRWPAIPATGQVFVTRSTASNTIYVPLNTVLISSDGSQSFTVVPPIADPTNIFDEVLGYRMDPNVFTVPVMVRAVTPGSGGNISANSLKLQSSIPVTKVTNPVAFQNGKDAESDAAFISRFRLYINSLSRATPSAIENAIVATNPNYYYVILENYIAIGQPQPGCVLVIFDDGSGLGLNIPLDPTQQTLGQQQILKIVNELKTNIEAVRAAGVTVFVQTAQTLNVSVSMEVAFANTAQRLASVGQIQTAVAAYVNSLGVGQSLYNSKLIQVIYNACPNLQDLSNLKLTAIDQSGTFLPVNPQGDLIVNQGQVLRNLLNPPQGSIASATITVDY